MSSPFAPPGPVPPGPGPTPPYGSVPPPYGYAPQTTYAYGPPPAVPMSGPAPGQLGAAYQGSPYLPPRVAVPYGPPPRRRNRIWIPIACLALVLVLALGVGVARLTGTVFDTSVLGGDRAAGLTFTDLDEVVTVRTSRGWWDDSPAEAGQVDADGLYVPSLVVVDGMTTIIVWIFPTIPAGELTDAHADSVDEACTERDCETTGSSRPVEVDGRPALSSTVTSTDDGDDLITVITTVIAPRHLVLIDLEGYVGDVTATDLDRLLAGITIDR